MNRIRRKKGGDDFIDVAVIGNGPGRAMVGHVGQRRKQG